MLIEIHRNETSQPIVYDAADNAYTKGNMYCVVFSYTEEHDGESNTYKMVHKYPLCGIFRITESYDK